jgi:hypothetical protein
MLFILDQADGILKQLCTSEHPWCRHSSKLKLQAARSPIELINNELWEFVGVIEKDFERFHQTYFACVLPWIRTLFHSMKAAQDEL